MVAPPLVTTREQVDRIVQILAESIEEALKAQAAATRLR